MSDYLEFLASKHQQADSYGFEPRAVNPAMKPFQAPVTEWAIRQGRAAIFADVGLGKTITQLEWSQQAVEHTNGKALILAPLAVAAQTVREGRRFGYEVNQCRSQLGVRPGINVTNYDNLDNFDASTFDAIALDESSILKSYMGKTKQRILESFQSTPYRLACTATPAPNDHMELGNHAEFLGIMPSSEMLTRFFINDTMHAGNYRLKHHCREEFWRWVCSWAACFTRPSDLGFSDDGYILPPLNLIEEIVKTDITSGASQDGVQSLFRNDNITATSLHREKKLTLRDRINRVAERVHGDDDYWVLWCETNEEADALRKAIPKAVEVRGSEHPELKEKKLIDFALGNTRVLITKLKIAGFGMNWQHCHNMAFTSVTHKYEQFYQGISRCRRFGQKHPVNVYLVMAETEGPVLKTIKRKQADHETMKAEMVKAMREVGCAAVDRLRLSKYQPAEPMTLPFWIAPAGSSTSRVRTKSGRLSRAKASLPAADMYDPDADPHRFVYAYQLDGGRS